MIQQLNIKYSLITLNTALRCIFDTGYRGQSPPVGPRTAINNRRGNRGRFFLNVLLVLECWHIFDTSYRGQSSLRGCWVAMNDCCGNGFQFKHTVIGGNC